MVAKLATMLLGRVLVREVCTQGVVILTNELTLRALAPFLWLTVYVPHMRPQEPHRLELLTTLATRLPVQHIAVHQLRVPGQTGFRRECSRTPGTAVATDSVVCAVDMGV